MQVVGEEGINREEIDIYTLLCVKYTASGIPLLPSGGVTVASVVNHEYRNHIRDWGPPWCFPLSQAGWADTIQGRRQLWAQAGFIWGRTVGQCRLGEQGRHRKLLPEMDKG